MNGQIGGEGYQSGSTRQASRSSGVGGRLLLTEVSAEQKETLTIIDTQFTKPRANDSRDLWKIEDPLKRDSCV